MDFFFICCHFQTIGKTKHLLHVDWNGNKFQNFSPSNVWKPFHFKSTETFCQLKKQNKTTWSPFLLLLRLLTLMPLEQNFSDFWSNKLFWKTHPPFCLEKREVKPFSFSPQHPSPTAWTTRGKTFPTCPSTFLPRAFWGIHADSLSGVTPWIRRGMSPSDTSSSPVLRPFF